MVEPIDWVGAWTLEDYVIELFETQQTHSNEFQAILRFFGRPKIVGIWEKYQKMKSEPVK